jgi:integrase
MLATAAQEGAIQHNPALGVRYVPVHPVEGKPMVSLSADTVLAIIAVMPEQWRVFFSLLAESGCRVSELLGLRWENVHLGDDPTILVCEQWKDGKYKRLKTESSPARLPLSLQMAQWLVQVKPEDATGPVFPSRAGTPLNYSNLYNRVLQPALEKCGLPRMGFHPYRKACGSLLVNAGMDLKQVQQRLRHAQLATTLACYVEDVDLGRGAAEAMGGLLWGNRGTPNSRRHPQTRWSRTRRSPHCRAFPQTPATSATDS